MAYRTCTIEGCQRKHQARGLCDSHYGTWHRHTHGRKSNGTQAEITCIMCGAKHMAWRKTGKFCSDACKGKHYSLTKRTKCDLPVDHPVRVLIRKASQPKAKPKQPKAEWRTPRDCAGCGGTFCPLYTPVMLTCSKRCTRRVHRWRRKALEANAVGTFTWGDFMRIAQRFDFCCAYCGDKPTGQLDPDHVVPLSRGGYNSTANLLPACRACNADKRNLLLDEWVVDRERRGLPPRMTAWDATDKRFHHLTQAALVIAPAA